MTFRVLSACLVALSLAGSAQGQTVERETPDRVDTGSPVTVFDMPRLEAVRDAVSTALARSDIDRAARIVDQAIAATPEVPDLYLLRAILRMRANDAEAALEDLRIAVRHGYAELDNVLANTLLAPLRAAAVAEGLVARSAAQVEPDTSVPSRVTQDGALMVTAGALTWDARVRRYRVATDLPDPEGPPPGVPVPGSKAGDAQRAAARNLNRLIGQGRAAGFRGLLYDNRDGGHSPLDVGGLPGLVPVRYGPALRERKLTYGIAEDLLFDRIVIGNSSTAYKQGRASRSLVRAMMTRPNGPVQAWIGFSGDQIYTYPEHRDHDGVDRYPANWPYTITSQGSSYDDRPFVKAAAWALAALSPETRAAAKDAGLAAATVQMILRRSQSGVRTRADYYDGRTHPTAFQQGRIRLDRIVGLAASLTPETLPPVPVLTVESENFIDAAGLLGRSERLFDTPQSVARVWRGFEARKEMVLRVSAEGGALADTAGFEWRLLRGDPEKVRIAPIDGGKGARVSVDWHDRMPVRPGAKRKSDRVDIAVFATTPDHDSVPAFVSILFPTHQDRVYASAPDGNGRLISIDYSGRGRPGGQDPLLFWRADWRDAAVYGADGSLAGWRRSVANDSAETRQVAAKEPSEDWTLVEAEMGLPWLTTDPGGAVPTE